jgi:hypothetical protein
MTIPLLSYHGVSTPGRGPENTTGVFFWVSADRQHPSAPPVTLLDGSLVNTWYDQSYYDHHVFGTLTARPSLVNNDVSCGDNSLDTLLFDGQDDKLQSVPIPEESLEFTTQVQFSVHIAFIAGTNTDGTMFSIHDTGNNRDGISVSLIPGSVVGRISLGLNCGEGHYIPTVFSLPAGLVYNDTHVHTLSFVYNQNLPSNQLTLTTDGNQVAVSLDTSGLFAGSRTITLGQYGNSLSYPFSGKLLEVIAQFTGSEDERAVVYNYFQRRWCAP